MAKTPDIAMTGIVTLLAAGATHSFISWILSQARETGTTSVLSVHGITGLLFMVVLSMLAEKLAPLANISYVDWIYRFRPAAKTAPRFSRSLVQLIAFGLVGAFIGASFGDLVAAAAFSGLAIVLRYASSAIRRRDIPTLLTAGKTALLSRSALVVGDSEINSSVVTETQLRWHPRHPTGNYIVLAARRFARRPHLILALIATFLFAWTTVHALKPLALFVFLLSWSVLGAEVARCANFARLGGPRWPEFLVLVIHAAAAVTAVFILAFPINGPRTVLLTVPAILWTGIVRSRPRRIDKISVLETGLGIAYSPEIVSFYFSGILPSAISFFYLCSTAI